MSTNFLSRLHCLCEKGKWDQAVEYIMSPATRDLAREEAVKREGSNRWTPLTMSCVRASTDFLKLLVDLAPEAVEIPDQTSSLPLHFVACWRRSKDCPEVLHLLIGAQPRTLIYTNQWGQTPLHSAFDSNDFPSSKIVRILLQPVLPAATNDGTSPQKQAVMMKDRRHRLPLHHACESGAPYPIIRLLIGAWQDGGRVPLKSAEGRLPIHLYATYLANLDGNRAGKNPQSPPSLSDQERLSSTRKQPPPSSSSNIANKSLPRYGPISAVQSAIIELLLHPLKGYQDCCALADPATGEMALHCATKYNVSYAVLKKVLRTHPAAVSIPIRVLSNHDMDANSPVLFHSDEYDPANTNSNGSSEVMLYPLDLLEEHRPAVVLLQQQIDSDQNSMTFSTHGKPSSSSASAAARHHHQHPMEEFNQKSDLIFAHYPAVPSLNPLKVPWQYEEERKARLELRIIQESSVGGKQSTLSEIGRLVWLHWCSHVPSNNESLSSKNKSKYVTNFLAEIGRILSKLNADGLWKLTFVKDMNGKGVFIKIAASQHRTVFLEAEYRSTTGSMEQLFDADMIAAASQIDPETPAVTSLSRMTKGGIIGHICSFLNLKDAVLFSSSSTQLRKLGIVHGLPTRTIQPDPASFFNNKTSNITHDGHFQQQQQQQQVMQHQSCDVPIGVPYRNITHSILILPNKNSTMGGGASKNSLQDHHPKGNKLVVINDMGVPEGRGRAFVYFGVSSNYPQSAASSGDHFKNTFEHSSIKNKSDKQDIQYRLRTYDDVSRWKDGWIVKQFVYGLDYNRMTPLHHILTSSNTLTLQSLNPSKLLPLFSNVRDRSGRLPLHCAVYNDVSMEILVALIRSHPKGLTTLDNNGSTPLHVALATPALLGILPRGDTIKSLLWITPGEHACGMKDARGNLPLHLASMYGLPASTLRLLLDTYPDAAYRVNSQGELPLHISQHPTCAALLCKAIAYSPGALSATSFGMTELPLHIACEYGAEVEVSVLEGMCANYKDAVCMERVGVNNQPKSFPWQILLDARRTAASTSTVNGKEEEKVKKESHKEVQGAWDAKEDIIFSYSLPLLSNAQINPKIRSHYIQPTRIARIVRRIREEVNTGLSPVALQYWQHWCCYDQIEYKQAIANVVSGLDTYHLQYLAGCVSNSQSLSNAAKEILQKCFLFVGRYELEDASVEHLSANSVLLSGWDYAAVEVVGKIRSVFSSAKSSKKGKVSYELFTQLCDLLEIPAMARHWYLDHSTPFSAAASNSSSSSNSPSTAVVGDCNDETFTEECLERLSNDCNLDPHGARPIVIKFMLNELDYRRDVAIRQHLSNVSCKNHHLSTPHIPLLATFDALHGTAPTDRLYARHIKQRYMTSLYRYNFAIVMPRGEKNLEQIWREERLGGGAIRELLSQIGTLILELHSAGVVHCDLSPTNIIRHGNGSYSITDFDAACFLDAKKSTGDAGRFFPGSKFSSSILPPEMLSRLDVDQTWQYNRYWRRVSDDAKDLKLLTPDDVQAITDEVKVLIEDAPMLSSSNANGKSPSSSSSRNVNHQNNWKESISSALAIMTFDDLPSSLSTCCNTMEEFSHAWDRILHNAELWEKIKPRTGNDGSIYVVKTYNGTLNEVYSLPYDLLPPNEQIDVWSFGCLVFQLCSGGPLFKTNRIHDLDDVFSYKELEDWNKERAEHAIRRVSDPLAKDLLLKLLREDSDDACEGGAGGAAVAGDSYRFGSMKYVLRHPFFGSTSNLEALKILEKHEEQQLLLEETTTIPLLTSQTLMKLEHSTERHCKIVFETEDVVAPTCLVALPYQLKLDITNGERLIAPEVDRGQVKARMVGQLLLDLNAATARLSFWLAMKKNFFDNGDNFQEKLAAWFQRASSLHITKEEKTAIAKEVITAIDYSEQYLSICMEMLDEFGNNNNNSSSSDTTKLQSKGNKDGRSHEKENAASSSSSVSSHSYNSNKNKFNNRSFIKDPMGVAKDAIRKITFELYQLYSQNNTFLYLIDEYHGRPVLARPKDDVYPILIHHNLLSVFLPFMNIACMANLALRGTRGLAGLIGLKYENIPQEWNDGVLIHYVSPPAASAVEPNSPTGAGMQVLQEEDILVQTTSSVAEFAVLQDVLEKLDPPHDPNAHSSSSNHSASGSLASSSILSTNETHLRQLEGFFRERDQSRTFSGLRRLCNGRAPAIWTTLQVVKLIQDQALQASLEARLKMLKEEWLKREKLQVEIAYLSDQLRMLCPSSQIAEDALDCLSSNFIIRRSAETDANQDNSKKNINNHHPAISNHNSSQQQQQSLPATKKKRSSWTQLLPSSVSGRNRLFGSKNDMSPEAAVADGSPNGRLLKNRRRRQSWSAFDSCPKPVAGACNPGEEEPLQQQNLKSKNNNSSKRRSSFANILSNRRRAPSADSAIDGPATTSIKQQKTNRRKRQSWSAFAFGNRNNVNQDNSNVVENGKPLSYLEDDLILEDGQSPQRRMSYMRERSPSVDSIFRRPSVELGAGTSNPVDGNGAGMGARHGSAFKEGTGTTNVGGGGAGRRGSNSRYQLQAQQQQPSSSSSTQKRASWTDKLKMGRRRSSAKLQNNVNTNNNYSTTNNNDNSNNKSQRRVSGRGSWRNVFGNKDKHENTKERNRPAPLIDDPDPDEDDGGEYFLQKRGKRPGQENVVRLDYRMQVQEQEQGQSNGHLRQQRFGKGYSDPSLQQHDEYKQSSMSANTPFRNENLEPRQQQTNGGYGHANTYSSSSKFESGQFSPHSSSSSNVNNDNQNSDSGRSGRKRFGGIKNIFKGGGGAGNSNANKNVVSASASNANNVKSKGKFSLLGMRRGRSVPEETSYDKYRTSELANANPRSLKGRSLSYADDDSGYRLVM